MQCSQCGAPNRETARFCWQCGVVLVHAAPATEPPLPAVIETPSPAVPVETPAADTGVSEISPPDLTEPVNGGDPALPAAESSKPNLFEIPTQPAASNPSLAPLDESIPTIPYGRRSAISPGQKELSPGVRLQDRFEIVVKIGQKEGSLEYEAHDLARCWQCQTLNDPVSDNFCVQCGAELSHNHPLCTVRVSPAAPISLPVETVASFEENGWWYVVLPAVAPSVLPAQSTAACPRLAVGLASDPGRVREQNEDSVLALTFGARLGGSSAPVLGLYALADGMGGHEGGEVASEMALRVIAEWMVTSVFMPEVRGERCLEETAIAQLTEAVRQANGTILSRRHQAGTEMGATLTAALVLHDRAIVVNVGDSRTYLWRAGQLTQLTTDHSAAARLIAVGEIPPEALYAHPQKSAIYRCLGDKPAVEVDYFVQPLYPGDWLLLCCDGVWDMLRPEGLEEVLLTYHDPQIAADEIIRRANLAGGEDNVSVLIVALCIPQGIAIEQG